MILQISILPETWKVTTAFTAERLSHSKEYKYYLAQWYEKAFHTDKTEKTLTMDEQLDKPESKSISHM